MLLTVHLNDVTFKYIISVFLVDTESVVTRTFVQKRALKLQFEESWNYNFFDNSKRMIAKLIAVKNNPNVYFYCLIKYVLLYYLMIKWYVSTIQCMYGSRESFCKFCNSFFIGVFYRLRFKSLSEPWYRNFSLIVI